MSSMQDNTMEELPCKGPPAQVAQTILGFLYQDHELAVFVDPKYYGTTYEEMLDNAYYGRFRWPTFPPDVLTIGIEVYRYLYDLPEFKHPPDFVNGKRTATFFKRPLDRLGDFVLLAHGYGDTRLLAGETAFHEEATGEGAIRRYVTSSLPEALRPIWERVIAELHRLGLVIGTEPTQAERDEDAPKIGAPRPTGSAGNTAPTHNLLNIRQRKLLQELKKHFNEDELRSLCFDLGVDYEDLQAQGKAGKARELILYQERRGDSDRLIDRCRELRPTISWEDTSGISPIVASE
jgi:hypothetical protein